jgi:esterase/lipase superfamily enzyme
MTILIDLRAIPSGGFVAKEVKVLDTSTGKEMLLDAFRDRVDGRSVVLVTHGFNVSEDNGIRGLSGWDALAGLPPPHVFVGVLWPGDSRFLPVIDYPLEGTVAMNSAKLLAPFLDQHLAAAASVSFVSHSLGARMVLETIRLLHRETVSTVILMAAAIEDNTLTAEFAEAAKKILRLRIVASVKDWVLEFAFPVGNPVTEQLLSDHPLFRRALGRKGPTSTVGFPASYELWPIPERWDYGHLDYMPGKAVGARIPPVITVPAPDAPQPAWDPPPWKPCWSAAIIASNFR